MKRKTKKGGKAKAKAATKGKRSRPKKKVEKGLHNCSGAGAILGTHGYGIKEIRTAAGRMLSLKCQRRRKSKKRGKRK